MGVFGRLMTLGCCIPRPGLTANRTRASTIAPERGSFQQGVGVVGQRFAWAMEWGLGAPASRRPSGVEAHGTGGIGR